MRVRYAPRARDDIASIHQYILERNERAANAVVRDIRATASLLGRYPGIGRQTQIDEVRVLAVARYPYLVYYRLAASEVTIIHVRDGRRDNPTEGDIE